MKPRLTLAHTALLLLASTLPLAAQAGPEIGEAAPAFERTDTHRETHALEGYRGSWVVLEWFDYDCPYTRKHYRTGNIPSQQERWTAQGVVWLSVLTSPAEEGATDPGAVNALAAKWGNSATAVLLDDGGALARAYEARTTPHLFVIDPEGTLAYMGGIDDVPTSRDEDLARATQLVDRALEEATAGEPVSVPISRPYGCVVKY